MDFKSKILSVARGLHFKQDQFDSIGIHDWPAVFKRIEAEFIIRKNSNTHFNWWWENLKKDNVSVQLPNDNAWTYLHLLIDRNEKVWFVGCDSDRDPSKFWLFEGFVAPIQQLLGKLSHFEYYLISKKYNWFLAANHHGTLIGLGSIKNKLQALSPSL
jgi:hypothetical protein